MVQVDLITGFLGAGKTTFLRRYVRYLVEQGHNVCILENDFPFVPKKCPCCNGNSNIKSVIRCSNINKIICLIRLLRMSLSPLLPDALPHQE